MGVSRAEELIVSLLDFEKKIEEIKKEIIRKGSSTLLEIADKKGREISLYADELMRSIIEELNKQVADEKKRIEEIKTIEKNSLLERMRKTAERNFGRAVEGCYREALRLLGL